MDVLYVVYIAVFVMILFAIGLTIYAVKKNVIATPPAIMSWFSNMTVDKISDPEYHIQEIEDFLTPEECDELIAISSPKLTTSLVYSDKQDLYDTKTRKSDQAWLKDYENSLIARISQKVAKASKMPIENQEDLQVVSYPPGGFFTPHYDACDGNTSFCERMDGASGPRLFTYLIYLNDDFEGGETVFPKLNIAVKPKKGKCVVFQNTKPDANGRIILEALHGGNPVTSGNKWICNKWIRVNKFIPVAPVMT